MYLDLAAATVTLALCVTATALGADVLWLIAGLVIAVAIPVTFAQLGLILVAIAAWATSVVKRVVSPLASRARY